MADDMHHEILMDLSRCNACAGCCEISPDIFQWDSATEQPCLKRLTATHDEVREAIALCPKRCISAEGWEEEDY